jgi:hypothetical protein
MSSRSNRYAAITTAALVLAVTACGSDAAPSAPRTLTLASHFDSIFVALRAKGTADDTQISVLVYAYLETPAAYGAMPQTVTVTTDSGPQQWQGFAYEMVGDNAFTDSMVFAAVYRDANLSQLVVANLYYDSAGYFNPTGSYAQGAALGGLNLLSPRGSDSTFTASGGLVSAGGMCPVQTGLKAEYQIGYYVGGTNCERATFRVSFQATFFTASALGPLSSVSVSNIALSGVRFSGGADARVTPRPR